MSRVRSVLPLSIYPHDLVMFAEFKGPEEES